MVWSKGQSFFFFLIDSQLAQHHLLKTLSIPYCSVVPFLGSWIKCLFKDGSVSDSFFSSMVYFSFSQYHTVWNNEILYPSVQVSWPCCNRCSLPHLPCFLLFLFFLFLLLFFVLLHGHSYGQLFAKLNTHKLMPKLLGF